MAKRNSRKLKKKSVRRPTKKARDNGGISMLTKGTTVLSVPLRCLHEWEDNPRINEDAAQRLVPIIRENGFIDPVIATPEGERNGEMHYKVRAGHTRCRAVELAGGEAVPVLPVQFKSEEAAVRYSIADNKASEFAQWDENKLLDLFTLLDPEDDSTAQSTGFTQLEIEGIMAREHEDLSASDFADVARQFEAEHGSDKGSGNYWLWVDLPSEEALEDVRKACGVKSRGRSRELSYERLAEGLGLPVREAEGADPRNISGKRRGKAKPATTKATPKRKAVKRKKG